MITDLFGAGCWSFSSESKETSQQQQASREGIAKRRRKLAHTLSKSIDQARESC